MAAWFIVLGVVVMISIFYTFEADHFYGIAESREIVVNSEMPVEIKRGRCGGRPVHFENLRLELADAIRPLNIQIELLEAALSAFESPKKIQVERLEKELEMLRMVTALSDGKRTIKGTVVGVGARFVPYPVRLRKHPDLQIWGREVHVRISDNNLSPGACLRLPEVPAWPWDPVAIRARATSCSHSAPSRRIP